MTQETLGMNSESCANQLGIYRLPIGSSNLMKMVPGGDFTFWPKPGLRYQQGAAFSVI